LASPADVHSPVCGVSWPVILRFMLIRAVAATLCVVVALVGCSSDPEPEPLPPIESLSPSPVALPMPSEAAAETPQGAAAFARYYLDVVGRAFATADPSLLDQLSAAGCGGCDALIASVNELREQGRKRVGGEYTVTSVAAPPVEEGDVVVEIAYVRAAGEVVDAAGRVQASAPAVPQTNAQMRLVRSGRSWIVQGYRVVE
jgi:hypothetical protein